MTPRMQYNLVYTAPAVKSLRKFSPYIQKRLGVKLEFFISQADPLGFARPLTKPADAQYRFRVGDYRILFDVDGQNIIVLKFQHRREVYKK